MLTTWSILQDGRVVFMLPWLEATIAGTTDSSAEITMRPQPSEEEIRFILDSIAEYLTVKVRSLARLPCANPETSPGALHRTARSVQCPVTLAVAAPLQQGFAHFCKSCLSFVSRFPSH